MNIDIDIDIILYIYKNIYISIKEHRYKYKWRLGEKLGENCRKAGFEGSDSQALLDFL